MHDVAVTLVGNVVSDPQERITESGSVVTNFRMAVNPRKYDKFANRWLDGESMFFNVVCWRTLAGNVTQSVSKGDPVIVQGKLRLRRWESEDRSGIAVEIDAVHIGHDLTRGVAAFTRTKRG
ncbi:MAG: single-stranded DNA-binding protein, partial [Candidatus Nanopelagicales bacterium]